MGSGDWNDGMSTIGNKGKGESVWLGWFLYSILDKFVNLCEVRKDTEKVKKYSEVKEFIKENLEKNAWDGGWYRRAYFDDGTPLCKMMSVKLTLYLNLGQLYLVQQRNLELKKLWKHFRETL
jgi:cellobiose phosphorylase